MLKALVVKILSAMVVLYDYNYIGARCVATKNIQSMLIESELDICLRGKKG